MFVDIVVPNQGQMEDVYRFRHEQLRDPSRPMDGSERDGFDQDPTTTHVAAYRLGSRIVGAARMHQPDPTEDSRQIRFVAVSEDFQGHGLARELVQTLEEQALLATSGRPLEIFANARVSALGFWQKMDYRQVGDEFESVGLPHVRIEKTIG